jgi:hypothetical protein
MVNFQRKGFDKDDGFKLGLKGDSNEFVIEK